MKSAIYLGKENIEIQNRPMPELGNYDVLIKNIYSSIYVELMSLFINMAKILVIE